MEKLIAIVLFLFLGSALAGGPEPTGLEQQVIQDYQQIQQQAVEAYQERVLTRCEQKVKKYEDKVRLYPTSTYYNWKLDSWRERCKDER